MRTPSHGQAVAGGAATGVPNPSGPKSSRAIADPQASLAGSLYPEADRRQVTVLFADVAGYTTLAERLDPEEVRAFQNELFEALSQSIARHDGFVEKFVGDAVLAIFGAPVAHEDDPERAVATALDMLARGAQLSERWAGRLGQPLKLHIGIHTGPVVAGNLGTAAAATYAVTGDTVNTTARLLAAASGSILVSDATYALTKHRFAFDSSRELTLRGKAEPVVVHRLVGVLPEPQSGRGLAQHGLAAAMIGRSEELQQLVRAFKRMQGCRAQVVNLVGEAGVGKTRLIAEFLGSLRAEGLLTGLAVRHIGCSSLGEPTYGTFSAIFREGYHVAAGDSLDVARRKLSAGLQARGAGTEEAEAIAPVLSYVLGVEEARPHDVDPEQLQRQIALAARTLIELRLRQGPLLIIVEDLHWADTASIGVLRDVIDRLANRPLMVLVSHRPDLRPPIVARVAQSIIRLAPLSQNETRALLERLFGRVDGDAFVQLEDFVATRAGGNPMFVEEIVRSLVSAGTLVRRGDAWVCTTACEDVDVPATLRGLLLSRVDRLQPEERRLLQTASVLGMTFDEPLLRAIAGEMWHAESALDRLVDLDLLQEMPPTDGGNARYRFTHALVHEVVYQNLLVSRRTELHERAGRALEAACGDHPERLSDLETLAHHWALSSDKRKGARYLVAAGDWARAVYANEDAIRHYDRASAILVDCRDCDDLVLAARERLADIMTLTGRRAEALAYYETMMPKIGGDSALGARLYRKIGALHWEAGDRESASACFASGLKLLGEHGNPIERAQLFQETGRLAFRGGDNAGAISWAEQALAEEARGGDAGPERAREAARTRAEAYNTLGVALARTGRLAEAVEQIEHSIKLAETHEMPHAACRGYTNLGVLYSSLDPRRSIDTCRRGLETARKVGDLAFQSRLYANLAVAYCALTDRCDVDGVEAAQKAIDLDRKLGLLDHLAVPLIVLGQIHQCHGDHALAFASYEEALGLAEQVGEPQLLFPCYDGLATLHLDAGNHELAELYLAKSQEVCERAGVDSDALMLLPFLC